MLSWMGTHYYLRYWLIILHGIHVSLSDSPIRTSAAAVAPAAQNSSTPLHQSGNNNMTVQDPCAKLPLTPDLWEQLGLDEYLRTYPSGNNLTLEVMISSHKIRNFTLFIQRCFFWLKQEYAEKVGATNFVCGIGKTCNANQVGLLSKSLPSLSPLIPKCHSSSICADAFFAALIDRSARLFVPRTGTYLSPFKTGISFLT